MSVDAPPIHDLPGGRTVAKHYRLSQVHSVLALEQFLSSGRSEINFCVLVASGDAIQEQGKII